MGREAVLEVRGRVEFLARTLKRVLMFACEPERAVEFVLDPASLQHPFGLEAFKVRQVAQRGEAERLQELLRRHVSERGARLGGANGAVDQALALERGDDVAADLSPRQPGNLPPRHRLQISDRRQRKGLRLGVIAESSRKSTLSRIEEIGTGIL